MIFRLCTCLEKFRKPRMKFVFHRVISTTKSTTKLTPESNIQPTPPHPPRETTPSSPPPQHTPLPSKPPESFPSDRTTQTQTHTSTKNNTTQHHTTPQLPFLRPLFNCFAKISWVERPPCFLYVVKDNGVCLLVVHVCRTVDRVVGHPRPSLSRAGLHRCALMPNMTSKQNANPFLWLLECGLVDVSCVSCVRFHNHFQRDFTALLLYVFRV